MNRRSEPERIRLNRFLARAGLGSRRAVEALIRDGRVAVNGETSSELGRRVDPEADTVTVDGREVAWPERWRTFAFHKPVGVISSLRPQGRTPCLDLYAGRQDLPPGVVPVGRLDADTSGLLLWTDDGDLHQALCRPRSGVWKTYEVGLTAPLPVDAKPRLCDGDLVLDGRSCRPARLSSLDGGGRRWRLALQEGRNRQVRRMFRAVGVDVVKLHRSAVGSVTLGDLPAGAFRELEPDESRALAREAGLGER